MPSLKDIRKRIASVKNTQKITKAMKLVSASKLRRAQDAMIQLRPYANKQRELLESLVAKVGGDEAPHPLLARREEVRTVGVLAINSDRGMCGGFNSYIQKKVTKFVTDRQAMGQRVVVYPLGRRIGSYVIRSGYEIGENFGEVIPAASTEGIRKVADTLVDGFLDGTLDEVVVVFNVFENALSQVATVHPLLPVAPPESDEPVDMADLIYEPDQVSLLRYIVPRYVEVQVRRAILESIAGEHAARMTAMSSATDNASDMISSLTLQMNRARQAAITKELMEIIGGSEALK